MDLKQLDYFREIVDSEYNLSKAAKKLHITQPSLSMLVNSWEKQYGIKLFIRDKGRYTSLTREGEYVYNHAINLLELHNNFLYSLEEIQRGFKGNVKIGIPPFIISVLFSKCILSFINEFPDINFTIVEEGAVKLAELLESGELDMAVLIDPIDYEDFETSLIYSDRLIAVINNNLDISKKPNITIPELADKNIVTFTENFILNQSVKDLFRQYYLHPNITFSSTQWDLLLDIVEQTPVYSIFPNLITNHIKHKKVTIIPLVPIVPWNIVLALNNNHIITPAARCAYEYINNYFLEGGEY